MVIGGVKKVNWGQVKVKFYLTDKNEAIVSALIASDILLIKRIHSRIEFFWISVNFSLFTTRLNTE